MSSSFSTIATALFSTFVLVTAYQSPYIPVYANCPSTPLVRHAPPSDPLGGDGICQAELNYITQRYQNAQRSLANWLQSVDATFCNSNSSLPVVALTTSGGGYRSLLTGAGVIQGFDLRENLTGVSGIFQSLTYQTGLSGGAWLLSSLGGNNYPTISSLRDNLWQNVFRGSLVKPFFDPGSSTFRHMQTDVRSKHRALAGYHVTLTDSWARTLSRKLLINHEDKNTLSGITGFSNFTNFKVPYPIITAVGVNKGDFPGPNGPQYEFHPYEFGSWDSGVNAFTQTAYLGTRLFNGQLSNDSESCVMNFDNIGFILGTSSNLFNFILDAKKYPEVGIISWGLLHWLYAALRVILKLTNMIYFAVYPNPFYNYSPSSLVSSAETLLLVDGSETDQNNPIWPLLRRGVDVIMVNDNSADTKDYWPNGSGLYNTYIQSVDAGLTRMPVIPSVDNFPNGPTFFGCNDMTKVTIVYLPNHNYIYPSNRATSKISYERHQTKDMIANGVEIASKGGDPGWPLCLACGLLKKEGGTLPSGCSACFKQYCYN